MRIDIPFKFRPFNLQLELVQTDFLFHETDFPYLMEARNSFFLDCTVSFEIKISDGRQTMISLILYHVFNTDVIIHVETYHQSLFFHWFPNNSRHHVDYLEI